ncbi:hypothetical protein D3C87_1947080 [compost metagenome]
MAFPPPVFTSQFLGWCLRAAAFVLALVLSIEMKMSWTPSTLASISFSRWSLSSSKRMARLDRTQFRARSPAFSKNHSTSRLAS